MNDPNAKQASWWRRLWGPAPAPAPEPPHRADVADAAAPHHLAATLAPGGVLVWDEPVSRDEAVRALVDRVVPHMPGLTASETRRRLAERDALGPTSIGEGVDLPHARIEGIDRSAFAIGLPRGGVRDAEDEMEVIWLLLLPPGGSGLRTTAQVARACRDQAFRAALRSVKGAEDARAALARWERAHESTTSPWAP